MAEPAGLTDTAMDTGVGAFHPSESTVASQNDSVPEPTSAEVEIQDTENLPDPIKLVSNEDQKTLMAVLQFLKKNNLSKTIEALENESEKAGGERLSKISKRKLLIFYLLFDIHVKRILF